MQPAPTIPGAIGWAVLFLGEVAFKWIPGVVATVVGTGAPPPTGVEAPSVPLIASPVTVPDAVRYLQEAAAPGLWDRLYHDWSVFVSLSLFVSLLFSVILVYCTVRIWQIRAQERRKFAAAAHTVVVAEQPQSDLRWKRVLEQLEADDDQGWRLSILEADIMLGALLDTLGYKGETIADKLKQVERADFRTVDMAWEAHKVRNRVAHGGMGSALTKADAERAIALYQRVFREFHFIE